MVVLSLQSFQQVESPVAEFLLGMMPSVCKEHWDGCIDHQQIQRRFRKVLLCLARGRTEGVVRLPIGCDVCLQHLFQFFDTFAFQQLTESCLSVIIELGQLGEADMWEVLRPPESD